MMTNKKILSILLTAIVVLLFFALGAMSVTTSAPVVEWEKIFDSSVSEVGDERLKWDIDGDNKKGLKEAIHAFLMLFLAAEIYMTVRRYFTLFYLNLNFPLLRSQKKEKGVGVW